MSTGTNVVLITVDTLRADRTGPYRPNSHATPAIAKLATQGTLFEAAISPMQMTRPSHYSLFTSLYPRDHGVVNNKISLESGFRNLAEVLRAHGYDTAGFVGVSLLGPESGAERGFEHFDSPTTARTRPAEQVVGAALQWLAERPREKPFFLWIHLFDPHTPYAPPPPFAPAASGAIAKAMTEASIEQLMAIEAQYGGNLPRAAYERAVALYQGDVEYTDHWIGRFIDQLESSSPRDRTAIALTADHGECFENGIFFEHSDCLYEGAARIPLIFRYPSRITEGARRSEVVEILDVAPTLLALVGVPIPESFLGRDLFDDADTARGAAFLQHPLYSNIGAETRKVRKLSRVMGTPTKEILVSEELLGIRTDEWKYLVHGEHEELYHLPSDPAEARDVASENPEVTRELREKLEAWSAAHPQHHADVGMINDELRATLEALGYLH
ncbi:MAG: sulfatase [Deltaproteobacteria bacterium]|nr:sulfatase [Deltaproteobacteria bacterium]